MFTQNDKNSTGANKKPAIVCYIAYLVLFFTLKKQWGQWLSGHWIFFLRNWKKISHNDWEFINCENIAYLKTLSEIKCSLRATTEKKLKIRFWITIFENVPVRIFSINLLNTAHFETYFEKHYWREYVQDNGCIDMPP